MTNIIDEMTDKFANDITKKLNDLIIDSLPVKVNMSQLRTIKEISSHLSIIVDRYGWSTYSYKNKPFLMVAPYEFNEKFDDKRMSHSLVAEFKYIKL